MSIKFNLKIIEFLITFQLPQFRIDRASCDLLPFLFHNCILLKISKTFFNGVRFVIGSILKSILKRFKNCKIVLKDYKFVI